MSSLFSPKLKPQRMRSPSSGSQLGQIGHVTGEQYDGSQSQSSSKSNSAFSRMRKKRPQPISISVENGNVILTSATPTSRVIYADPPWAPSPSNSPTPHAAVCTSPWCRESGSTAAWDSPSNPQSPTGLVSKCCSPAELPPCNLNTSPVELEASSTPTPTPTPTTQAWDNGDEQGSDPPGPPDLIPSRPQRSSKVDNSNARKVASRSGPGLGSRPLSDPRYNGKRISSINMEELPVVQPGSTSQETTRSCRTTSLPGKGERQSRVHREQTGLAEPSKVDANKDSAHAFRTREPGQIHADREAPLLNHSKDDETSGLLRTHHSRISTLCDFIQTRVPQIHSSDDATAQQVMDIIRKQHQEELAGRPFESDKQHMSQTQHIHEHQAHAPRREKLVSSHENMLRTSKNQARRLAEDVEMHHQEAERMTHEIREKDAQIATLNSKVAQLLNMSSLTSFLEKSLPSPTPKPPTT